MRHWSPAFKRASAWRDQVGGACGDAANTSVPTWATTVPTSGLLPQTGHVYDFAVPLLGGTPEDFQLCGRPLRTDFMIEAGENIISHWVRRNFGSKSRSLL